MDWWKPSSNKCTWRDNLLNSFKHYFFFKLNWGLLKYEGYIGYSHLYTFGYGHTNMFTPLPVRSAKLSMFRPCEYCLRQRDGKARCCILIFFQFCNIITVNLLQPLLQCIKVVGCMCNSFVSAVYIYKRKRTYYILMIWLSTLS